MFISHLFSFFYEDALTKAEAAVLYYSGGPSGGSAQSLSCGTGCSRKNSAVSPPLGIASAEESPLA